MIALYASQQIRAIEQAVISSHASSESELMERAGHAALQCLIENYPDTQSVLVCCGKGNNGGDGLVLARLAHQQGLTVQVYLLSSVTSLSPTSLQMVKLAENSGVKVSQYHAELPINADVIVDALLGIGLQGEVREPFAELIERINSLNQPVLAIDSPSGLNSDTGEVLGCSINAHITLTFIARKKGFYTHKGPVHCGKIVLDTLGIADSFYKPYTPHAEILEWKTIKPLLPRRARDAHKGDYGHVLIVGGDYGMGGAVRMAAEAAMRVGAGLVSVATRPEHVSVVSCQRPEIMCHQVAQPEDLIPLLKRATVLVVGPGLGRSEWAQELLNLLLDSSLPKVLDADALNLLAEKMNYSNQWVLTPHPGEASRLIDCSTKEIQQDRFTAIQSIQKRYGGVVVLKGIGTIIKGSAETVKICAAGNPGMATGGMGDILSGIIGGFIAQNLDLYSAAQAGVLVHALAADQAAMVGGERGLLATDLLTYLRELVNPE